MYDTNCSQSGDNAERVWGGAIENPRGIMAEVLDCGPKGSKFELHTFTFGLMNLGKGLNPYIS